MSETPVTLTIDGIQVRVPAGTLIVDAAKQIGIDIPVFCYHPKLEEAGMCRMCLVEVGRPQFDRSTRQPLLDEQGNVQIAFGRNLETSCTTPVAEGMQVRVHSEKADQGRKEVVEYLLTSHPLDCPICDKGGECPLQDLTMRNGPGKSRFLFEDKQQLDKHVPLGDLIWLDKERCIQCARCIRFQAEIADDPVLAFGERGRKLEIVTHSDPGFDSYFSGNSTDVCPVGALTTEDFRFGARPWELNAAASICTHCPVGCNLTLNTRREAKAGGQTVVKRVLPRQNEGVNEIWICDKGRFAHHYAGSADRIRTPLVRRNGILQEATWEEALARAAEGLKAAGNRVVGVAGGRPSNEDFYNLRRLIEGLGGQAFLLDEMAGGDLVSWAGLAPQSNLGDLGPGDVIVVAASDLHEEAPIWWLRVIAAVQRGARLLVANARPTRLNKYAEVFLQYRYGEAAQSLQSLLAEKVKGNDAQHGAALDAARSVLQSAANLVVFYGCEGTDFAASQALAAACARLVAAHGKPGQPNNGLIPVWGSANLQGAWDMGLQADPAGLSAGLQQAAAVYVLAADPAGQSPAAAAALREVGFLVVQELFHSATTELANVVLPAQSFIERDGSLTSGERRVQRFFPAVRPQGEVRPDWAILAQVGQQLGIEIPAGSAAQVFAAMADERPGYEGLSYADLGRVEEQWPPVGGQDLYFGGTATKNRQGLGVQLPLLPGQSLPAAELPAESHRPSLLLVSVRKLLDRGGLLEKSALLEPRLAAQKIRLSPADAARLGVVDGAQVELRSDGKTANLAAVLDNNVPQGAALVPRSLGLSLNAVEVSPSGR